MDLIAAFNLLEALWWLAMAAVCWWKSRDKWKRAGLTAAAFFILFAMSDVIESQTGAWWEPRWLAVWKGCCVVGLLGCGVWVWRIRRQD